MKSCIEAALASFQLIRNLMKKNHHRSVTERFRPDPSITLLMEETSITDRLPPINDRAKLSQSDSAQVRRPTCRRCYQEAHVTNDVGHFQDSAAAR